jgi:putative FmdB family regulatory protein
MPVYDYMCQRCGPFTDMRPMAECDLPRECPHCGEEAPRVLLSVPYVALMSSAGRLAHATNERSAAAPLTLSTLKKHGAGCGCCAGKPSLGSKQDNGGLAAAKSFPTRRPWMLSH